MVLAACLVFFMLLRFTVCFKSHAEIVVKLERTLSRVRQLEISLHRGIKVKIFMLLQILKAAQFSSRKREKGSNSPTSKVSIKTFFSNLTGLEVKKCMFLICFDS